MHVFHVEGLPKPQPRAKATTLSKNARPLNEIIEHQVGGALNPTWVEWLMGLPLRWTELTDSEPSATEWSRWLQLMRSSLSRDLPRRETPESGDTEGLS